MTFWRQDLTYALRRLSRSRGFAAAAIISIGIGIAANSTIFSMVSRFVLRPLPVGDPSTLMAVQTTHHGECCNAFSWPLFTDLRAQARSFSGLAGFYELLPASIGGSGEPQRVWGQAATANFFNVTQLRMAVGRGFAPDEENHAVIVISHRLWQGRFGADPQIAGRVITLSGHPFTVIGVAPPSFRGLDLILDCQFWVPLATIDQLLPNTSKYDSRNYHWITVAGRLKPGVTSSQAAAELDVLARRISTAHPGAAEDDGFRLQQAGSLPSRQKSAVLLFLTALSVVVLLVLAIACANVANLLLAQASGRRREMAVRVALGAARGRLVRQLVTESLLLGLGGGAFGIALSVWATRALAAFRFAAPVPLDLTLTVDWRVLIYTLILSAASGVLFGLVPAWGSSRPSLSGALKGDHVGKLRSFLVVCQIAMSVVLLCATGLFLRSLRSAMETDAGFRSRGILMMSVDPRLNGYSPTRTAQFFNDLRQRAAALPGVQSATVTDIVPLSGGGRRDEFRSEGGQTVNVDLYMVSRGYFETMGIPLRAGRDFASESATSPRVAVVNEEFARRFFGGENPVGRRVSGRGVTYEIIGIAGNIKSRSLGEEATPVLFRSLVQDIGGDPSFAGYSLLVRSDTGASGLDPALRREIHSMDPSLAVFNAETMEEHLRQALFLPRLAGALFGVFGIAGLLLASIGLYGVMSYSVSQRTREIGIRVALGSRNFGVQMLIVQHGFRLTLAALVLGMGGAWAAARFAGTFLYGVQPHDPVTFTGVPLFLTAVALMACWIPARRAAKIEPIQALRHE